MDQPHYISPDDDDDNDNDDNDLLIPLLHSTGITNTLAMQVQQEQVAEAEGVIYNNVHLGKSINTNRTLVALEETSS
jgi:hypothetical protein